MYKEKNVISLFDGLGGLQIALNKVGIQYDAYFAWKWLDY